MQTFSASEAKHHLGLVFDAAQQEPISIEKRGRPFVVVLSQNAYKTLEDAYWIVEANKGKDSGFLSDQESRRFLEELHHKNVKS